MQGCKWAAITIIVVSAPVLGKVTQVSFERTLGTISGGLLGYITVILGHKMLEASDILFTGATPPISQSVRSVGAAKVLEVCGLLLQQLGHA